jgi:CBS domain-containing protein
MMNVAAILKDKGSDVVRVAPDMRIQDMVKLLAEKRIGSVLVTDKEGRVAGLASERDVIYGIAEQGQGILERPVSEVMVRKIVVCNPQSHVNAVMASMTERRVRHLPVMDGDEVVGIVSIGDMVKARIAELEFESQAMREYIATAG